EGKYAYGKQNSLKHFRHCSYLSSELMDLPMFWPNHVPRNVASRPSRNEMAKPVIPILFNRMKLYNGKMIGMGMAPINAMRANTTADLLRDQPLRCINRMKTSIRIAATMGARNHSRAT